MNTIEIYGIDVIEWKNKTPQEVMQMKYPKGKLEQTPNQNGILSTIAGARYLRYWRAETDQGDSLWLIEVPT